MMARATAVSSGIPGLHGRAPLRLLDSVGEFVGDGVFPVFMAGLH